jgi:hypothetical protein
LWNRQAPLDYRELNEAISSIRILRPGEMPSAPALGEVLSRRDIFERAYAFDGIDVTGRLGEKASISFGRPAGANSCGILFNVRSTSALRRPLRIAIRRGEFTTQVSANGPGPVHTSIPLAPEGSVITFEIQHAQSPVADGSLRLESVTFK